MNESTSFTPFSESALWTAKICAANDSDLESSASMRLNMSCDASSSLTGRHPTWSTFSLNARTVSIFDLRGTGKQMANRPDFGLALCTVLHSWLMARRDWLRRSTASCGRSASSFLTAKIFRL